jgi:hypothetical protein
MVWGRDVALWSAETMIKGAVEHMAENEFQAGVKLILRLIAGAKDGVLGGRKSFARSTPGTRRGSSTNSCAA